MAVPLPAAWIARGLTELIRLAFRLAGVDVAPQPTCLNSICALPASNLVIDSTIFQRTLTLGIAILLWIVLAGVVALAAQAVIRGAFPRSRTADALRKAVTAKSVAIALACAIIVSGAATVLANLRGLSHIAPPSAGMEWAEMK